MAAIDRELAEALPPGILDPATGALDGLQLLSAAVTRVRAVDATLDLSSVAGWYVEEDYAVALAALSREVGREVTATANAEGSGCAMVVHGHDGEHVALSLQLVLGIFCKDEALKTLCLNILHHELCHVHDGAVQRLNLLGEYPQPGSLRGWPQWLFPFAQDIWAEYYADRRAYPSLRDSEGYHLQSLEAEVRRFPSAIQHAFRDLKVDDDASKAFTKVWAIVGGVAPCLENLCKHLGYVMGTLAAKGSHPGESALACAGEPWLRDAWVTLEQHLDHMYRTHGRWPGIGVYQPLTAAVESMLANAGMSLTNVWGRPLAMPA